MPDPLLSLVIAAAVGGLLALFFWPENGLFWRWQRTRQITERVRIEDGLKYLYEAELEGRCADRTGLAVSEGGCRHESCRRHRAVAGCGRHA